MADTLPVDLRLTFSLSAHRKTDSTNTRSALMWIHAMKASLKFTFSHRTKGPWRTAQACSLMSPHINDSLVNQHLLTPLAHILHCFFIIIIDVEMIDESAEQYPAGFIEKITDNWLNILILIQIKNLEVDLRTPADRTNCFFLSVDSRVSSSLSAFISSSLYWKSRTVNLQRQRRNMQLFGSQHTSHTQV